MNKKLEQLLQKITVSKQEASEGGGKRKKLKKEQWFLIALCGILLIILAVPSGKKKTEPSFSEIQKETGKLSEEAGESTEEQELTLEEYTECLEKKLEEALTQMAGVGEVKVVITMASSVEKVVEKEQPVNRSNTAETDSQGGSRNVNTLEMGDSTVYSTQNGQSTPYVVKVLQPQVEGVIVVAQGAGNGNVNRNISEAVQVLFGIEAHKIKVLKMKTP